MLVEHGTLFGELPSGGFDQIATRRDRRPRPVSSDDAALEAGTD